MSAHTNDLTSRLVGPNRGFGQDFSYTTKRRLKTPLVNQSCKHFSTELDVGKILRWKWMKLSSLTLTATIGLRASTTGNLRIDAEEKYRSRSLVHRRERRTRIAGRTLPCLTLPVLS